MLHILNQLLGIFNSFITQYINKMNSDEFEVSGKYFKYDKNAFKITNYRQEGVSETLNSKAR